MFDSFRLFVVRGKPEDVFPELFKKWNVTRLTYEYDTEPYSLSRDEKVTELAKEHKVDVSYKVSHTLYDIERCYSCLARTYIFHPLLFCSVCFIVLLVFVICHAL